VLEGLEADDDVEGLVRKRDRLNVGYEKGAVCGSSQGPSCDRNRAWREIGSDQACTLGGEILRKTAAAAPDLEHFQPADVPEMGSGQHVPSLVVAVAPGDVALVVPSIVLPTELLCVCGGISPQAGSTASHSDENSGVRTASRRAEEASLRGGTFDVERLLWARR
jgi:hypothetical protein